MVPGECIGGDKETVCGECNTTLPLKVCHSPAGYYLGYICPNCGPFSRESRYFPTEQEAELSLKSWLETKIPRDMRWA